MYDHIPYYLSGLSSAHFSDNLSRDSCIHKVGLFSAFISHLIFNIIFQAGNVHESPSFFFLKERKIDTKDSRIRTHDPDSPAYSLSTRPLRICWMDKKKFQYI